jgi:hypothetical protein
MSTTLKISSGDIVVGATTGRPQTISNRDVLKQHIVEDLSIETLSNGFGAGIESLVGSVPRDTMAMQVLLDTRIASSIEALRRLQTQGVTRAADELVTKSTMTTVRVDQNDPRIYRYSTHIKTVAGQSLAINGNITR